MVQSYLPKRFFPHASSFENPPRFPNLATNLTTKEDSDFWGRSPQKFLKSQLNRPPWNESDNRGRFTLFGAEPPKIFKLQVNRPPGNESDNKGRYTVFGGKAPENF